MGMWHVQGVNAYNFYDALYAAPYIGNTVTVVEGFPDYVSLVYCKPTVSFAEDEIGVVIGDVKIIDKTEEYAYPWKVGGSDRYKSSVEVAKSYKYFNDKKGVITDTVILVSGEKYPDGLSASGISGLYNAPVLLTQANKVDDTVKGFIKDNKIKKVIIVGGEKTVSEKVVNSL